MKTKIYLFALNAIECALDFMLNRVDNEKIWHRLFAAATKIGYILDKSENK